MSGMDLYFSIVFPSMKLPLSLLVLITHLIRKCVVCIVCKRSMIIGIKILTIACAETVTGIVV